MPVGMQNSYPIQKIVQLFVLIIFLVGTSLVVWRLHDKAYDDLPTFYWATHLAFKNEASAYQPRYFQQLGQKLDRKIYPFFYPPPSIIIFSPFLLDNYEQIKAIFTLCNLVLWWLLTWLMYRLYCFYIDRDKHFVASLLIPVWSLFFIPVIDTLRTGQVNLFVLVSATPLFFQPSRHYQQLFGGVLFAMAIILKVYLLLALLMFMFMGQKKVLLGTFGILFLLCVASFLLLPVNLWPEWLMLSHDSGGYGKQLPYVMTIPWNQSINGFFIRQFLDKHILIGDAYWRWPIYIGSGAVLTTTFYMVFKILRHEVRGVSISMALIFLVVTVIAPLTWLHHYVFTMPAVICYFALLSSLEKSMFKKTMTVSAILAVMIISMPLLVGMIFPVFATWKIVDKSVPLVANLVISAQLMAGIVFWGLFSTLIFRSQYRRL